MAINKDQTWSRIPLSGQAEDKSGPKDQVLRMGNRRSEFQLTDTKVVLIELRLKDTILISALLV